MNKLNELIHRTRLIFAITLIWAFGDQLLRANQVDSFTEPYRTINVSSSEQGVVTKINVKEGDAVHEGQLLATLDMDVLLAAKKIAKAGMESLGRIKSATAAVALRTERFQKLQELQADGHAHPEEVLRAKTELEIAEGELLAAKEDQKIKELEYSRIETQIERRKIISPIDGFVTKIHKEVSEQIAVTDPVVLTLVQCNQLKVVFPIPAAEAARFSIGQKIAVSFPGESETAKGTVEVVSRVTEPESGTVRVKIIIDNVKERYRSGMPCFLILALTPQTSPFASTDETSEK
jgi:RND family efflux transporter MFP subunit